MEDTEVLNEYVPQTVKEKTRELNVEKHTHTHTLEIPAPSSY